MPRSRSGGATIEDVAALAGVSRAAVSKVIRNAYGVSPAMRERVGEAIQQLSYRPRVAARAMRGSTYTIGFEVPDLKNQFFSRVLSGASAALADTDYQMILAPANVNPLEPRAVEALLDHQVDGLVAIAPLVEPAWLDDVARRVPVVMFGRHDRSDLYDSVVSDDELGARVAMRHLLELG